MTQYVINIGTLPNDGTGDPLRTAFNEVNLNFDQVFAAGPVLSNIQIANNTILTTNTNGNLVLAPNGIGVVQSNVHIVPNTSNIRNLGTASHRWSELYIQYANISGNLDIAGTLQTGDLTVDGNLTVTGNTIQIGNLITDAKTLQLANTAASSNAANGSGITVGANDNIATMLYSSGSNSWVMNIGIDTPNIVVNNITSDDSTFVTIQDGLDVQGDITAETVSVTGNVTGNYFIGNGSQLTGVSNYANANAVAYGQAGWTGNIVPAASNTYSLGNSTLWWSNVWVAGNTMYIGGVPIGMSAGNVLTVNGNAVLQNDSSTTISTTGNITADYFFGNGSQLTGINVSTSSISNGTSNVDIATANGPVTVSYAGSGNTWTFGNVNVPEALYWPDGSFQATAFVGVAQDLSNPGNATITSNSSGNTTYAWTFDDTGNMTFPSNGQIVMDGGDGTIGNQSDDFVISWDNEEIRVISVGGSIEMQADAAFRVQTNYDGANVLYESRWEFSNNEIVNISNNFGIVSEAGNLTLSGGRDGVNSGNSIIRSVDVGVAVYDWTFANNGNLVLPSDANIVGTTPNNAGHLQWLGNSAGDGSGSTTLRLIPDDTLEGNEQYIIIDPTGGGDIHIRPGGNIDNSNGRLILGGENSAFVVESGSNPTLKIFSDENEWSFYGNAELAAPGDISAVGNITGNFFVGDGSQLTNVNAVTVDVTDTNGLTTIYYPTFVENRANAQIARADVDLTYRTDENLLTVGNVSVTGNVTAGNLIGNISITGNVTGTTPNVTLIAGSYSWTFDNTGNLQGNVSFTGGNITINNAPGGNEGAEIQWALPAPANTVLNTSVIQDVYQNGMRFFESGGNSRGLYMDLGNVPNGATTAVGYRDIPQISFTGNTTIVANAAGRHYYSTESTDYTLTIANNTSVSWSVGTAITIVNRGTGNMTIAQGTGVSLYLAGNSTAGNRTVTTYGMATLLNVAANVWMINGTGVS